MRSARSATFGWRIAIATGGCGCAKDEEKALLQRWALTIQPLTPLVKDAGAEFEAAFEEQLVAGGETVVDMDDEFALRSHTRAVAAEDEGKFELEV